jgi:hypothetical protein
MNLNERRNNLIQKINNISDEQTLEMIEETLAYFTHANNKDITDGLTRYQLEELTSLVEEPAEKGTISHEELKDLITKRKNKAFAKYL